MQQDDEVWGPVIAVFGGLVLAVVALPTLVPKLAGAAVEQLLAWELVVPAGQALVRVPGTAVGLDGARLLLIGGGVLLLAALGRLLSARRGQER